MRTWERNGYSVKEMPFDYSLHEFAIVRSGVTVAVITPASLENMETIVSDLDAGEDVNGWEDGMGNTISI